MEVRDSVPSIAPSKLLGLANDAYSVAILLCTLNGDKYLREQLESIANQSYKNWWLYISDDGSNDDTIKVITDWMHESGVERVSIFAGPREGFAKNFLSLVCNEEIKADAYAFCDQDDIWLPGKLDFAIGKIAATDSQIPFLYCGRTIYADKHLKKIGDSPSYVHPATFRNALVQCIAGANTMVFNKSCRDLLMRAGVVDIPSHDWWVYLLVTGAGGSVYFDQVARVIYRQHPDSLVGGNQSFAARFIRAALVINGQFKIMIDKNVVALRDLIQLLTIENQRNLEVFQKMRSSGLKDRFRLFEICGLYRQSWRGTVSLIFAVVLGKL